MIKEFSFEGKGTPDRQEQKLIKNTMNFCGVEIEEQNKILFRLQNNTVARAWSLRIWRDDFPDLTVEP